MIRDVGSLGDIRTLVEKLAKQVMQNSDTPVSIEVLDKLDVSKYLVKLADKALEALSQKELVLKAKYWAVATTDESGTLKLSNLVKKPQILQSDAKDGASNLSKTLDFEKLKSAVEEYAAKPEPTKAEQSQIKQEIKEALTKDAPKPSGELPQKAQEAKGAVGQEVKTEEQKKPEPQKAQTEKEQTSKAEQSQIKQEIKEALTKDAPKPSGELPQKAQEAKGAVGQEVKAEEQKKPEPPKGQTEKGQIESKAQELAKIAQKPIPSMASGESASAKEQTKQESVRQKEDAPTKGEASKVDEKKQESNPVIYDKKSALLLQAKKDEPIAPKEQVKQNGQKAEGGSAEPDKPSDVKSAKPEVKISQQQQPVLVDAKTAQAEQKEQKPTVQTRDAQSSGKNEAAQQSAQPQTQSVRTGAESVLVEGAKTKALESLKDARLEAKEESKLDASMFAGLMGGMSKDEIETLIKAQSETLLDAGAQELEPEGGEAVSEKVEAAQDASLQMGEMVQDENALQIQNDEQTMKQSQKEQASESQSQKSTDGPSSKIKQELLENMSKAESKQEFQLFSNVALNLNKNGFTAFVRNEDGEEEGVLQFRKKKTAAAAPKTVEFYSAFEHLGPIAGEIWQYQDKTYLTLEVEFESTLRALNSHIGELGFFDSKNVTLKKGVTELFATNNSFLNLVG